MPYGRGPREIFNNITGKMKMKTKVRFNIVLTILLSSIYTISYSQKLNDSLSVYLGMAARNNPSVLQKYSEYQAALQKVPQAGSLPDPELSLGIFIQPMELVGGNQVADIRLMQMFPWFGVLKNARDEMSLMARAKYELFREAKLRVCYELQQNWYELSQNRQAISISAKNLEILRTIERVALVRFRSPSAGGAGSAAIGSPMPAEPARNSMQQPAGMTSMGSGNTAPSGPEPSPAPMAEASGGSGLVDLYRIRMEAGELENSIALLMDRQKTLTARFNAYLNRPPEMKIAVPDSLERAKLSVSLTALPDSMIANNPMLGMLSYEIQSIDARKQMIARMGYPMVGLGVNYSLVNANPMASSTMNGKDMVMPMVTVTLPVYRKKYNAMKKETDFLKTAAEQGIRETANSLQVELREVLQEYQDAERRMDLYGRQHQLAIQSLNILVQSFSASGAGLTDLLRMRQQALDYGLKQSNAVADYNTSVARLQKLMAASDNQNPEQHHGPGTGTEP